mgnify:CR=1 FL=1
MDKKEQASQPALQTLKEYAVITAAVLIMDIGIYVFKFPNNFSFGGVSGMAVVICRFLPFTASQINLFINLLLLLVGFAVLGRNFGVKTAYVTVLSSVLLNIFEKLFPMAHPLTNEIMLELCFAIILPALAAALLFFENASGGGTDIIAMIIKKYSTMNISTALLVTDLIVVILAFLIFDTLTGLCSVLGLMAKTLLIDKTIERMKLNKFFTIISNNPQPICDFISITAQPFTTPSALTPTSSGQSFSRLWMSSRPSIFSGLFMIPSRPRLLRSQRAAKLSEKAS